MERNKKWLNKRNAEGAARYMIKRWFWQKYKCLTVKSVALTYLKINQNIEANFYNILILDNFF